MEQREVLEGSQTVFILAMEEILGKQLTVLDRSQEGECQREICYLVVVKMMQGNLNLQMNHERKQGFCNVSGKNTGFLLGYRFGLFDRLTCKEAERIVFDDGVLKSNR